MTRRPRCRQEHCLRPADYGDDCKLCYERRIARECRGITAQEQLAGEYRAQIGMRVRKGKRRKA